MILKRTIRRRSGHFSVGGIALSVLLVAVVCSSGTMMALANSEASPYRTVIAFSLAEIPFHSDAATGEGAEFFFASTREHLPEAEFDEEAEMLADATPATDPAVSRRMTLAFADLPEAETVGGRRMLNVSFDLGARGVRAGDLEVSKRVNLDGRSVGSVGVVIDQYSQLHVSTADLSQVLPSEMFTQIAAEGDYVAFDTLRTSGINVRYDPVNDTLEMAS